MILYSARLTHVRHTVLTRRFTHRMRTWLVDLDELSVPRGTMEPGAGGHPFWSRLATFRAADHLGSPDRSIRANLDAWLASHQVPRPARVLMLAAPRSFGYAFNPLTVYWCYAADGSPLCVVAEVHNTYGERHCYLLHPDERWRSEVGKELYVSPFFAVTGRYRLRLPPPDARLSLTVTLHQDGDQVFTATLVGHRIGSARPSLVLRYAFSLLPHRVRFLVQRHGVALWLRRLSVVPRTPHLAQEGVR